MLLNSNFFQEDEQGYYDDSVYAYEYEYTEGPDYTDEIQEQSINTELNQLGESY